MKLFRVSQGSYRQEFSIARTGAKMSDEVARMSSGSRIQNAYDDVASLAISTKMRTRTASLRVIMDSMRQADSLLQIADKGLSQIEEILSRMAALATQSNSGGITLRERLYLNQELQNLKSEINRIAEYTDFNGQHLLNGEMVLKPIPMPVDVNVVTEENIFGTSASETLNGNDKNNLLQGGVGDDEINAVGGDNIFSSGVPNVLGVQGRIYRSLTAINNLTQAENIAATQPVWATFVGTSLDYPLIGNDAASNVNNFLSNDASSLNPTGLGTTTAMQMVFVFDGKITVPSDGNYNFAVGSDDGFNLRIAGNTIAQFTGIRAFGTTSGSSFLAAGEHDFRLIYWENVGSEGLLARSNLAGAGLQVLNVNHLFFASSESDGDDILNGTEQGIDIATYSGRKSDYTITQISPTQFMIEDNRAGSPNGTDVLNHINIIRFADEEMVIVPNIAIEARRTIDYIVNENGAEMFSYEVIDARISALFDGDIDIINEDNAIQAFDDIMIALDYVAGKRAYVGAKMQQAGIIFAHSMDNFREQSRAKAELIDTNIAQSSTEYSQLFAKYQIDILLNAQAMQLDEDVVRTLLEEDTVD
jgi:flagellin-like hook-associated protein FlgL